MDLDYSRITRTRFVTFEENGRFLFEEPPRHLVKVSCLRAARAPFSSLRRARNGGKKRKCRGGRRHFYRNVGTIRRFTFTEKHDETMEKLATRRRHMRTILRYSGARDVQQTPPRKTRDVNAVVQTGPCLSTRVLRRARTVLDPLGAPRLSSDILNSFRFKSKL